jgi:hypothetical protein
MISELPVRGESIMNVTISKEFLKSEWVTESPEFKTLLKPG